MLKRYLCSEFKMCPYIAWKCLLKYACITKEWENLTYFWCENIPNGINECTQRIKISIAIC